MTGRNHRIDMIASLCCVGFLSCWTIGAVQIKYLTGYVDVWTQNLARYTVACLFWLPFLFWSVRRGSVDRLLWKRAIWPAAANIVHQITWAGAFYFAKPAFVILMTKTSLIWLAAFSIPFFVEERALVKSFYFWLGLVCSGVGVAGVIIFQKGFSFETSFWGAFLGLSCSVLWALYTILVKIAFRNTDSRVSFSVITIYSLAGLAALAFVFGKPVQLLEMDAMGWMYVIVSAVTSIALAHVFFYVAIRRIGVTIPSMTLLSTPVITLVVSRILFQETLTLMQWTFGAILITGGAGAILAQRDIPKSPLCDNQA